MKIRPWKTLARKTVLKSEPWVEVESHRLKLPTGEIIEDWTWIKTPDFVNVVAVTEKGLFICFHQQKYAAEGVTLAICGGYLDPGESAEEAARRELQEECGMVSEKWTSLGNYAIDGNRGCGTGHFFLAEACEHVGGEISDDLEDQEQVLLSREEVLEALNGGSFQIMPWTAALALALLRTEDS